MKKKFVFLACIIALFTTVSAQEKSDKKKSSTTELKRMTWTTSSDQAREMATKGSMYHRNIEYEQAYECFLAAEKLDPNFTIPLVFLATMTRGETKKAYASKALASASGKTEGEKLFASLVDEKNTPESRREIWNKLHEMFPDGGMIGHYFVVTREKPEERMAAAEEYISKFPKEAAMHNLLGYYFMEKKDFETAKKHFEKYMEMYPEGSNPYDSMGEFYLVSGDAANAEKYYALSLERYPYNNNALDAMKKFEEDKKKKTAKND